MNALYWNYTIEDQADIANLDIFTVLQVGNGDRLNPIRLAWGKYVKQKEE